MTSNKTAFSLIELMLTVLITVTVIGGVIGAFSKVSTQTQHATRTSDMTDQSHGIWDLMKDDFKKAGTGFNDLQAVEFRYQFNSAFVAETSPISVLYGISDASIQGNGSSSVTLQYFDFSPDDEGFATFVAAWDVSDTNWNDQSFGYINILTNNANQAAAVATGDIFLFYSPELLSNSQYYESTGKVPWSVTGASYGGVILQVSSVTPITGPGNPENFSTALRLTFGSDTEKFINTIGGDPIKMENTQKSMLEILNSTAGMLGNDSIVIKTEGSIPYLSGAKDASGNRILLARRLGNSESFHRVTYHLDDNKDLIRSHNGKDTIIAANVQEFKVKFGLDAPVSTEISTMINSDIDGRVSMSETTQWVEQSSDLGGDTKFLTYLGKFSVAADVTMKLKSTESDTGTTSGHYSVITIENFIKIGNSKPVPLAMAN